MRKGAIMNTYKQVENMREAWLNPIDRDEPDALCCAGCGKEFTPPSDDIEDFCSESCWHLHRLGEVKAQVKCWINQGCGEKQILRMMNLYWFYWMTKPTVGRWKKAIHNIFEQRGTYA